MKAFLLVCLIATSMMVNAQEIQDELTIVQTDSPSFLHLGCAYCCNGVCCSSAGNCIRGICSTPTGSCA